MAMVGLHISACWSTLLTFTYMYMVKNDQIDLISAVNHYDVIIWHVRPPRIRGGIRQVSGGTTAGPRRD